MGVFAFLFMTSFAAIFTEVAGTSSRSLIAEHRLQQGESPKSTGDELARDSAGFRADTKEKTAAKNDSLPLRFTPVLETNSGQQRMRILVASGVVLIALGLSVKPAEKNIGDDDSLQAP